MHDDTSNITAEMQALAAEGAETLDGVTLIMKDLADQTDMPRSAQMRLHALCDSVVACRDRMDRIADLLDS